MPPLSTPARLAGFGAALALTFGAATGLGALVDPTDGAPRAAAHGAGPAHSADDDGPAGHGAPGPAAGHPETAGDHGRTGDAASGHAGTADEHGRAGDAAADAAGGLASAQDGYRLVPERIRAVAGRPGVLRFRIEGPDGRAVRGGYELESERELHLIVVRRDGTGFQHLHPRRAADGTWSTPLTLASGGSHRVLADFVVGGTRRTLGVDVEAAGAYRPAPAATPVRTAAVDGHRVTLEGGPRAGREATLRFRVTRGGRPVAGLQPYLGARGHLVALREGDLAYLHVHPTEDEGHGAAHADGSAAPHADPADGSVPQHAHPADGTRAAHDADGTVGFAATFPAAGRHRLYLQFRTDGIVRTAAFVVDVAR